VTSPLRTPRARRRLAALALGIAVVPVAAGPADAATKHRRHETTRASIATTVAPKRAARKPAVLAAAPAPAPAPAAAPAVTSVISIGGYVFYNLTYAEAVDAYQAAVAAAPAGSTPPPVTSVSVNTTVGGTAGNG
jgi:hypothetical protein